MALAVLKTFGPGGIGFVGVYFTFPEVVLKSGCFSAFLAPSMEHVLYMIFELLKQRKLELRVRRRQPLGRGCRRPTVMTEHLRVLEKDVLVGVAPPARIFPLNSLFYCILVALFTKNKYNKK